MRNKSVLIFILLASLLATCNPPTITATPTALPSSTPIPPTLPPTDVPIPPSATPLLPEQAVLARASEVIQALKNQDMLALSGYVHPVNGLRFSPYAYVKDSDLVFPADKIAGVMSDSTVYSWGLYDGSGLPIDLTFAEYYSKFVYDVDFINAPQVALNLSIGVGNSMNNSQEFYPGAMIVEYHFPGFDPQYQGMDWRSLRLVFMDYNNTWYLVGFIHDQWTI